MTSFLDADPKDTAGSYKWLFNSPVLRRLARKIHSAASSANSDLEKLIFSTATAEENDIHSISDLDEFLGQSTMSHSISVAYKQQIRESTTLKPPDAESPDAESPDAESPDAESPDAESPDAESPDAESTDLRSGFLPDLMVFKQQEEQNICYSIKLKNALSCTSKEARDVSIAMHSFIDRTADDIQYQHNARFCIFHLDFNSKKEHITFAEVITGREFCEILGIGYEIGYDSVIEKQRNVCQDNEELLLSELIRSNVVPKQMLEERILELLDDKDALRGAQRAAAKLFKNVQKDWNLSEPEMIRLLGKDPRDPASQKYVKDLLEEAYLFNESHTNERMARLIQIREALFALFQDHKKESVWLNQEQKILGDDILMKLLLDGSEPSLCRVQEFVEATARW